jgi:hypothetical protein
MKVTCDWEKEMMGFGSWWYVRANKKYCVVRLMGSECNSIDYTLCYGHELADIEYLNFCKTVFCRLALCGWRIVQVW